MHIAKRYYLGEDITLIRFFHRVDNKRQYVKIDEIVTRCINGDINPANILFEIASLTIESEIHHEEYKYGYTGSWIINKETQHKLVGFNRLPNYTHVYGLDHVLDITWGIFEYKLAKVRAYEAFDLRYVINFLKTHESVMYPLIRMMNKTLARQ